MRKSIVDLQSNRRNSLWNGLAAGTSVRTFASQRQPKLPSKPKRPQAPQASQRPAAPAAKLKNKLKVITRYEDLPKLYKEEDGLDYRDTPITKEETLQIFGDYIDAEEADSLLRRVHGRRVAGTLGDPTLYLGFDNVGVRKALAWLRQHVPVDEIEFAGRAAEAELAAMEADLVADAERIGLYKKEKYIPNSGEGKDVYGKSGLDQIREDNLKRLDAIDAAKAKTAKKREEQAREIGRAGRSGTLEQLSNRSNITLKRLEDPRVKYHTEKAQQALPEEPLQMPAFQRLLPSALMTMAVILASLLLVETYTPPSRGARLFPEIPMSIATISTIVSINLVALLSWRILPARKFMMLNMIFHPGYPRVMALIGSIFSHQTFAHLAGNMFCVGLVGMYLHEEIGRAQFLAVFMSAGVFGGFTSLAYWTWRGSFISSSLGASGAACGLAGCYLTYLALVQDRDVKFFGKYELGGGASIMCAMSLGLLILVDVLGARRKVVSVDHWNHLGGMRLVYWLGRGLGGGRGGGLWRRRRSCL